MKLKTTVVGEEIPRLTKIAHSEINPTARNPIHTNDFARERGLRGALVGGSIVLGYAVQMLYNHFGEKWYYHGKIKVNFIGGGVVNGDTVEAHGIVKSIQTEAGGDRVTIEIWLDNKSSGNKSLIGEASCLI